HERVRRGVAHRFEGGGAVRGERDREALQLQRPAQGLAYLAVVVDDEQPRSAVDHGSPLAVWTGSAARPGPRRVGRGPGRAVAGATAAGSRPVTQEWMNLLKAALEGR